MTYKFPPNVILSGAKDLFRKQTSLLEEILRFAQDDNGDVSVGWASAHAADDSKA